MNKKNTISAKGLSRQATVQVLHMDDYFGDGNAYSSKPCQFGKFLDELANDLELEQTEKDTLFATNEDGSNFNLIEEWYAGSGDGNETFVLLTVVDGVVKVVTA
jgi:hypothetical protein